MKTRKPFNKKTIGIISSGLAAITLVAFFTLSSMAPESQDRDEFAGLLPSDYPILDAIPKMPVSSEQEASMKTKHEIKYPTYLPSGYRIQTSNVDEEMGIITILASPQPVTETTTKNDFISEQKGISIYAEPITSNFNKAVWIDGWIKQESGKAIKINGYDAVMHDVKQVNRFDETIQQPATVVMFKDDLRIVITSMLPAEELIKIAETL